MRRCWKRPPPQKRVAQEDYRRLPVVCESTLATEEVFIAPSYISTDVPIPARPLSERLIGSVDDSVWGMSKRIIYVPKRLEDPEIAEQAKAEMMKLTSLSQSNGRISCKFETGISVAEMFASFGTPQLGEPLHAIPNIKTPVVNPSNPMQPDWALAFSGGAMKRIRGLIQSNYADSSRPSLKRAVRDWARFCAKHGISVFRPQVADNWEAKVMEEMILMSFLEYLLFEVRVQGSTCEAYFMGHDPEHQRPFFCVKLGKANKNSAQTKQNSLFRDLPTCLDCL